MYCLILFVLKLEFKKNILKRDLRAHKRKGKKKEDHPPCFGLSAWQPTQQPSAAALLFPRGEPLTLRACSSATPLLLPSSSPCLSFLLRSEQAEHGNGKSTLLPLDSFPSLGCPGAINRGTSSPPLFSDPKRPSRPVSPRAAAPPESHNRRRWGLFVPSLLRRN